jgi:3-phenylpropionate/trans-cinnamate dioxygenase ferredoxin component
MRGHRRPARTRLRCQFWEVHGFLPSDVIRVSVTVLQILAAIAIESNKSAMPAFTYIEPLAGLTPGKGVAVEFGNNTVALFNVGGAIYAIEAACMRCGAGLADSSIEDWIISCRDCGWRYELTTGAVVGIQALRLRTFNVKITATQIIIADA